MKPGKRLTISKISDMEGNQASSQMVKALAGRIELVIKEMGLSAKISIGQGKNKKNGSRPAKTGNRSVGMGAHPYPIRDQGC